MCPPPPPSQSEVASFPWQSAINSCLGHSQWQGSEKGRGEEESSKEGGGAVKRHFLQGKGRGGVWSFNVKQEIHFFFFLLSTVLMDSTTFLFNK